MRNAQLAILAGDFLLAQASLALARLEHIETIALMSTVIGDLVQGEIMQACRSQPCAAP
jgi:geranylgeranyl pyrophosphate synthase